MSKPQKVKRYKHIYRGKGHFLRRILRVFGTLVIVAGLAFVGWNVYGTLVDYLESRPVTAPAENSTPSEVSDADSLPAGEEEPGGETKPEPEKPVVLAPSDVRAVYLPHRIVSSPALLQQALDALPSEINAVMLDLKDGTGKVLYDSSLKQAVDIGAVAENPLNLEQVCKTLDERGLAVIGRIHAFRDPYAAGRLEDSAVYYLNTEILWLDNSAANGGKAWLNPYTKNAQDYVAGLVDESVKLGVGRILLDSAHFPTGYGHEYASFGPDAQTKSRMEVLSSFIKTLNANVEKQGALLDVYIPASYAVLTEQSIFGGDPLKVTDGGIVLGVIPAQFGNNYAYEDFVLEAPILNPKQTVGTILSKMLPRVSAKRITGLVQGYTYAGNIDNNRVYTMEDIKAQTDALGEANVGSYIIYNPDGAYLW